MIMATKDWTSIGHYNRHWKKGYAEIEIIDNSTIAIRVHGQRTYTRHFKTKSQAIKFAKAYMRKH